MIKDCVIIFTGFNQRAVISFIRTLHTRNVDYLLVARSSDDTILDTDYKDSVIAVRQKSQLDLDEILSILTLAKERFRAANYLIAPSTEALNRFLLKNRSLFEKEGFTVPLVSEAMYEMISDKYSFGQICRKHSILVPEESAIFGSLSIPFVAKPVKYFSKNNIAYPPLLILTEEDRDQFVQEYEPSDFYFQKYVNGNCFYLLYYFNKNGEVVKFSQENIAQQPHGKSMVAAVPASIHHNEISLKFERMFQEIGFRGLVMVEIKDDQGDYYMIEANPRFWGPSQLFVDAGMNFFDAFLFDYGIISDLPSFNNPNNDVRYFWYGGICETIKNNEAIVCYSTRFGSFKEVSEDWLKYDIYRRNDSQTIFNKEIIH